MTGYWKGKKIPFYPRPNRKIDGSLNPKWRGGRRIDKDGYVLILMREHPYADSHHGYVREHRLVMEKKLGRYLLPTEVVHHINGIKADNRIENLFLLGSTGEHQHLEWQIGTYEKVVKHKNFACSCGEKRHHAKGLCKICYRREYNKLYKQRNK